MDVAATVTVLFTLFTPFGINSPSSAIVDAVAAALTGPEAGHLGEVTGIKWRDDELRGVLALTVE